MKIAIVATYMGILFCLTCTENFHDLLNYHDLKFQWISQPDLKPFFNLTDYPFSSPGYLQQKAGHAFCFFWLAVSFYWLFKRLHTAFLFSIGYATFTEMAQLYFSRTGCLLDVCYDSAGILLFIFIGRGLTYKDRSTLKSHMNSTSN